MSYRWYGEKKISTISIRDFKTFRDDPSDDRLLASACAGVIERADILVGHYSTRCDLPYIQTRLAAHGLKPVPPVPHVDTWRIAKDKLRLNSNRLDSLADLLKCPVSKTHLKADVWRRAAAGHIPSLEYIEDHCEKDIKVLDWCYTKLKPLLTTHPNVGLASERACPRCGEGPVHRRGFNVKRTSRTVRLQCQKCGAWSEEPETGGRPR